jgi:hypothetical protein
MTNKLVGFLVCGVTLLGAASFCMAQGIGDAGVQPAGGRGGFGARKPLPPVVVPDKDYTAWPLTPEQAQYKDIDGFHLKKDYLMPIVAISEKSKADGNVYWGRIAGTPYDQMMRDWVVANLKRIGVQNVVDNPVTLKAIWFPTSWKASVTSGGQTVAINTVFSLGGQSTPPGGLDLPIVYVGLASAADIQGKDLKGKAVLIYSMPQPGQRENSAFSTGAIERVQKAGAALIIHDLALPGMPDAVTQPGGTPGGKDDSNYVISIGPGESDKIRDMIGRGEQPTLHYEQVVEHKTGPAGVVTGILPGTTDENILIEAHTDSFFYGAVDNAAGVAQLMGLAEHYAKIPQSQRRRNIIFVLNDDHHSRSAGLDWVREHMAAQMDKTVIDFNCEHPAETQFYQISGGLMSSDQVGAKRINLGGTDGTPLMRDIVQEGFRSFGVGVYTRPDGGDGSGGDGFSTAPPRVGVIDHILYHTSMDVPEWVPAIGIERATQAYAWIVDEVNKHDMSEIRLPKTTKQGAARRVEEQ